MWSYYMDKASHNVLFVCLVPLKVLNGYRCTDTQKRKYKTTCFCTYCCTLWSMRNRKNLNVINVKRVHLWKWFAFYSPTIFQMSLLWAIKAENAFGCLSLTTNCFFIQLLLYTTNSMRSFIWAQCALNASKYIRELDVSSLLLWFSVKQSTQT